MPQRRRSPQARPGRTLTTLLAVTVVVASLLTGLYATGAVSARAAHTTVPERARAGSTRLSDPTSSNGGSLLRPASSVTTVLATIPVAGYPSGITLDTTTAAIFLEQDGADNDTVINTTTDSVQTSIPIAGSGETRSITFDPDNGQVVSISTDNLTFINGSSFQIAKRLPGGLVDPLYVASSNEIYALADGSDGRAHVYSNSDLPVTEVTVGAGPDTEVYDPVRNDVLVGNWDAGNVSVIGATNHTNFRTVTLAHGPDQMVYDPLQGVTFDVGLMVNAINDTTFQVTAIPDGGQPETLAFDPDDDQLFVANSETSSVTVIAANNDTVLKTLPVGGDPSAIVVDPATDRVFIANSNSNNVTIVSGATDATVETVKVGPNPSFEQYDALNGRVYVVNDWEPGSVTVLGTGYNVTFQETGLPGGTVWAADLGALTGSTSGTSIQFVETNGSYGYDVPGVPGYTAEEPTGTVKLDGAPQTIDVTFVPTVFEVTFQETGLPTGTEWGVTPDGAPEANSTTASAATSLANGTYTYTVQCANRSYAATAGGLTVDGRPLSIPVTFALVTFAVTIDETGLPTGTTWYVNITDGPSSSASTASIGFSEPNRTVAFVAVSDDKEYAAVRDAVTVDGGPASLTVHFAEVEYAIDFTETGLPAGTSWSVTVDGSAHSASTSTIAVDVPNGTYTYTVGGVAGYGPTPGSGAQKVHGGTAEVAIAFTASPSHPGLALWEWILIVAVIVAGLVLAALLVRRRKAHGAGAPAPGDPPPPNPPSAGVR